MLKGIFQRIDQLLSSKRGIDDELFEELEELLIQGDCSVHTTIRILHDLRESVKFAELKTADQTRRFLQEDLVRMLETDHQGLAIAASGPTVYLMVGVNGTGKTTTLGKLAYKLRRKGKKVLMAAADTFRAAAIEQLELWSQRASCDIIKHKEGADPAAVVFDAIQAAKARGTDYVLVDTAGRLHNKAHLMQELMKVNRVVLRELGRAADESLMVLDATTGQNGVSQARVFRDAVQITGLAVTKLDGTARGGIVVTIREELDLPIKLVGTGEKIDQLEEFHPKEYVRSLFG
ncbi:MAG TPA: signal recognition particle-docking protein FtsY [Armatimonadota bacterium]|nr:signal recognition particle-docking protein FtsY [Armatimonadota bacterium]